MLFFLSVIKQATVLLFGTTGEIITEKSGHLNLGIPGVMFIGALGGCVGVNMYVKVGNNGFMIVFIAILFAVLFAAAAGALYSFLTVSLRSNQNITGLAIATFGAGLYKFVLQSGAIDLAELSAHNGPFAHCMPFYENLGWFGSVFVSHGFLAYLAIIVALVSSYVLNKTRTGLYLRSVGENPATADAAGINVTSYRYVATIIGSAVAGLGGLSYIFYYSGFSLDSANASIDVSGWLAIALVIFTMWKPTFSIFGAIIFSILSTMATYIPNLHAFKNIIEMAPYLITIVILIVTSIIGKKETQPPAALGTNYFREER